jgi:hypothetical protein
MEGFKKMTQTAKQADIRYRVELKKNGIVVYKVVSSNGLDVYDVTVCHGRVNNCTCPAYKPCYHMRDVQGREDARTLERDVERTAYNNFCLAMGI